ncbi:hypothetical protein Tsubulata_000446 [Turnera subulata]|uniref:Rab3 GTPase-activating protein catalytic subunit n=1 Tax=Turnera subulata TaxID=218843 RepID=A0A9Q0JG67_9ROSI|nr:hypothetical protein Tsubulata_000446 [Turnera subulata]
MASTSGADLSDGDEVQEEELERFDDFTLASSWERFISEIEAICRQWMADGPKNLLEKGAVKLESKQDLYKVKSELKYAMKSYSVEYYFETNSGGKFTDWNCSLHDLQLCFGVKNFLIIAPQSASGVILDPPEASKLLSAAAIALTNCSSLWPAFVPVHDPSRMAYIGIQNMGTVFTRRFESDRISSQVPVKLMHLEGLYELFVSKFAYSTPDFTMHLFNVHFTMKSTYRTAPYDDDDLQSSDAEIKEDSLNPEVDTRTRTQWDDDCPWSVWYSAEDPVKGFELVATWSEQIVQSSLEMAELENVSPHEAENWTMLPILFPNLDSTEGNRVGFGSQLRLMVDALDVSFSGQFMEDFVSVEKPGLDNIKSSMIVPPPTVLDRVLKELFHEGSSTPSFPKGEHKTSRAIKGAPPESLFAQFCLHCLWTGDCNIRVEKGWGPLSINQGSSSGDVNGACTLAICIEKKCELNEDFQDCIGSSDDPQDHIKVEDGVVGDNQTNRQIPREKLGGTRSSPLTPGGGLDHSENTESKSGMKPEKVVSVDPKYADSNRRGSAGVAGSMMLLKSYQSLHAPFTQDAPPMTEDMHEERLQAVEALGDEFNFSAQMEKEILSSDMSAFKAANPNAVFEDFIRWHSPGDWEHDETEESGASGNPTADGLMNDWPPRGRLSQRMSDRGNLWRKIWNDAPGLAAYEQKPLLDPNREGEKILHYLETLRPHQLLEQMVCTAFRASADTLHQTNFGALKQMTTKMEQLYFTMVSALKPLQTSRVSSNSDSIEDLRRLCRIFEHVEKLLTLAASLHRKFIQSPRLSEAIFSDYYNFYLPNMGTGSENQREFNMKYQVTMNERHIVSNMFKPPTANQSWRKVLSMGNLLNGHEPIIREIIFSKRDGLRNHQYASPSSRAFQQDTETYRMYICGTSNDLRVALSVTSSD